MLPSGENEVILMSGSAVEFITMQRPHL